KDVPSHPSRNKFRRTLFERRNANQLAEQVVAIKLNQGVEIHQHHRYPGDQHDLVSEVVDGTACRSPPPQNAGCRTKNKFHPYSRDNRRRSLPLPAVNIYFTNIAKEAWRKIDEHKAHTV